MALTNLNEAIEFSRLGPINLKLLAVEVRGGETAPRAADGGEEIPQSSADAGLAGNVDICGQRQAGRPVPAGLDPRDNKATNNIIARSAGTTRPVGYEGVERRCLELRTTRLRAFRQRFLALWVASSVHTGGWMASTGAPGR